MAEICIAFHATWKDRGKSVETTNWFEKSRTTKYKTFKDTHCAVLTEENYHFKAKCKMRKIKGIYFFGNKEEPFLKF